jgi:hypothetical protein
VDDPVVTVACSRCGGSGTVTGRTRSHPCEVCHETGTVEVPITTRGRPQVQPLTVASALRIARARKYEPVTVADAAEVLACEVHRLQNRPRLDVGDEVEIIVDGNRRGGVVKHEGNLSGPLVVVVTDEIR